MFLLPPLVTQSEGDHVLSTVFDSFDVLAVTDKDKDCHQQSDYA